MNFIVNGLRVKVKMSLYKVSYSFIVNFKVNLLPAGADVEGDANGQQAPDRLPQGHPAEAPRAAPPVHVQRGDQRAAGS